MTHHEHQGSGNTGTRDATYDIISVVYHALQGAETVGMYIRDAEQGGGGQSGGGQTGGQNEVMQYFRDVQEQYRKLADRGKQLLGQHMSQGGSGQSNR